MLEISLGISCDYIFRVVLIKLLVLQVPSNDKHFYPLNLGPCVPSLVWWGPGADKTPFIFPSGLTRWTLVSTVGTGLSTKVYIYTSICNLYIQYRTSVINFRLNKLRFL